MAKSNEDFLKNYVDLTKYPSYAKVEEIFEDFRAYHGEENVPGGPWMQLHTKLGEKMIMDEEIYNHFGEESILKLIKNAFDPLFEEQDHKGADPIYGHTFPSIQNILSRSAKLGFTSVYKYMTDHVNPMFYDIDRLDLHTAIKYHNEDVLDIIIANTDDSYGKKGSFTHRIAPETKGLAELHTLSNEMKIKLSDHFEWLDIDTISGGLSLEKMVARWEKLSDQKLDDLIDNKKKGQYSDAEWDALKGIKIKRLKVQLAIVERELELENMK